MRRIVAALIVAAATATPAIGQPEVTEPKTGVKFSAEADGKSLLGVGLRIKKILFIFYTVLEMGGIASHFRNFMCIASARSGKTKPGCDF